MLMSPLGGFLSEQLLALKSRMLVSLSKLTTVSLLAAALYCFFRYKYSQVFD